MLGLCLTRGAPVASRAARSRLFCIHGRSVSSAAAAAEKAEALSSAEPASLSLLQPMQATLEAVHATSGLPWWSTFALCTVGFRVLLVPLSVVARRNLELLGSKECVVHTARALEVYERQAAPLRSEYAEMVKSRNRAGLSAVISQMLHQRYKHIKLQYYIWKMCGIKPYLIFGPPLLQLGAFVTYAVAVRDMIRSGGLDLSDQGALWFTDLALPDPTLVLPITAIALSYTGIQYGWRGNVPVVADSSGKKKVPVSPLFVVGYYMQGVLIAAFPVTSLLPAGVFMYWIPSATFSLIQMKALRQLRK